MTCSISMVGKCYSLLNTTDDTFLLLTYLVQSEWFRSDNIVLQISSHPTVTRFYSRYSYGCRTKIVALSWLN